MTLDTRLIKNWYLFLLRILILQPFTVTKTTMKIIPETLRNKRRDYIYVRYSGGYKIYYLKNQETNIQQKSIENC
jgi:hypothetical protein